MKRLPCRCGGIGVIIKEGDSFYVMCEECYAKTKKTLSIKEAEKCWNEIHQAYFDLCEIECFTELMLDDKGCRYVIMNMIEDVFYTAKHKKDFAEGMALYDAAILLYELWYEFMTIDERKSVLYTAEDVLDMLDSKEKKEI